MAESTPLNIEEMRRRLAVVHGVLIPPNDPVFALVALNNELLQHYAEVVAKGAEAVQIHAAAGLAAVTDEALKRAELTAARVVGAANDLAAETLATATAKAVEGINAAATSSAARMQGEAAELARIAKAARSSINLAVLAGGALVALVLGFYLGRLL